MVEVFLILLRFSEDSPANPFALMVMVLAPILLKLSVTDPFMASMAVRIPTRAIIPMAIIIMVRTERSRLVLTAVSETFKFSRTKGVNRKKAGYFIMQY